MGELFGSLESIGLPAILRFLEGLGKTGTLHISSDRWTGTASVTSGRVVAASFGSEHGVAALEAIMLGLAGGSFTFSDGAPCDEPNVELGPAELATRLDAFAQERTRLAAAAPSLHAVPRVANAPGSDGEVVLDKASIETLLAVNGERTIEEIACTHGVVQTARELARLLENGLISIESAAPETPTAAPNGHATPATEQPVRPDDLPHPFENGVVSRGIPPERALVPIAVHASPSLASILARIGAAFRDRPLLGFALALCLAVSLPVLVLSEGLPYVSDGNESFSTYTHARNMLRFGPQSTMGLTDEAGSPDAGAHPYVYTHQGNLPRLFSWILLLFGIWPIEWHIAIISVVVGLASTYFCYRFFSIVAGGGFALITCAVLWTDYLLFVQWQVNTFRVWHAFFIFALLYAVQSIQSHNARRVCAALLLLTFLLFYFELIFAVFTATFVATYALLLHRRSIRLVLGAWAAIVLGGITAMGLLFLQLIAYLGWDLALQDLRVTYLARNFAKEIGDSEERGAVLRFFLEHHIVFWDSFDATNYLTIGGLTKTIGSTVLAVYTPYLVLMIFIVTLGLTLGGLGYHLRRFRERSSSPVEDDRRTRSVARPAPVPILTWGMLVLASYLATALVFGDSTTRLPDGSVMEAVGLPRRLFDTTSAFTLVGPLAVALSVGAALWRWRAWTGALTGGMWSLGLFVILVAVYMLEHIEFYPNRSIMLWLNHAQGFVPPLALQVVLIACLYVGAYLAASGGGRRLWVTHGAVLRGAARYVAAGTAAFAAVYLLSPGYLFGGYLSRYSPIAVFVSDVAIALFVYVLLVLATEAGRRVVGTKVTSPVRGLTRGRARMAGAPWASAGLLVVTTIVLAGAGFYWLRLQFTYAMSLPPTAILFMRQLTAPEYRGAPFVSDNYALPVHYFTDAWAYQDHVIADNEMLDIEGADRLKISGKYTWFADRETNDAYLRPRYYLCRITPNADTIADLLMQPTVGRVTRCSGEAIVKSALEGVGGPGRPELRALDDSRMDAWAIVALNPRVRLLPWDTQPPRTDIAWSTVGVWTFRSGFHASEQPRDPLPRWTANRATIEVYPRVKDIVALSMRLVQPDFGIPRELPDLTILVDDAPLPPASWQVVQGPPGHYQMDLTLAAANRSRLPLHVEFRSPGFIPAEREAGSADRRTLGIHIEAIEIRTRGDKLMAAGSTDGRLATAQID